MITLSDCNESLNILFQYLYNLVKPYKYITMHMQMFNVKCDFFYHPVPIYR